MRRANVPIAALSLAISVLLWLVVFSQGTRPTITRDFFVPLTPDAIKDARWAIIKVPDAVRVSVTGTEARIGRLNTASFRAYVDLSKASGGTRNYPVQIFPASLRELVAGSPMTVAVEIEGIAQRRLPVVIDTKGELADPSLTLQSLVSDPTRALVTGPRSAVDAVRRVRGFLDLGDVSFGPGGAANVALEALDDRGRVLDRVRTEPLFARVRLGVAAAPEEKQVLINPTFRGAPAPGFAPVSYALVPTQLGVRGRSATLAALSSVPTETIDLSGLTADRTFEVLVRLPDGVRTLGSARVRVSVRVRPVPGGAVPGGAASGSAVPGGDATNAASNAANAISGNEAETSIR